MPATKSSPTDRVPCDRTRVLIADDEKNIRDVFSKLLLFGLPHCRIDVVINGVEAVEAFSAVHHAVILMDLHMPVMNGEEAFQEILKLCESENWEMPSVVFCTGYAPSRSLHKIIANSRQHCVLSKPIDTSILLEVLRARLAG